MQLKILAAGTPEYEAMKALRTKVLLDPIGVPHSYIDPQKEAGDVLIGAFADGALTGCCVLTHVNDDTVQLRQMAVDASLQRKGTGAAIVRFAETVAKGKGFKILVLHAREAVTGFYQTCGYRTVGERFFEVGIPHYKMEKDL